MSSPSFLSEKLRAALQNLPATPPPTRPKTQAQTKSTSKTNKGIDTAFVEDLIRRGEAVELPPGEELPPNATHEIVRDKKGNIKKVIRHRYY